MSDKAMTIHRMLEQHKGQIAAALPKHITPDRIVRLALTEVRKNKRLGDADPISLFGALVQASQLGLEPGAGGAWLVPFRNNRANRTEVQMIPDYRGLIDLARRTGEIGPFVAQIVRDGDFFEFEYGTYQRLTHRPRPGGGGAPIYVYAYAQARDTSWSQFHVMTVTEVETFRARSRAAKDGPWVTDWEAMARKTAVKQLCKYLPQSPELRRAVELDDRDEIGRSQHLGAVIDSSYEISDDEDADEPRPAIASPKRRSAKQAAEDETPPPADEPDSDEAPVSPDDLIAMAKAATTEDAIANVEALKVDVCKPGSPDSNAVGAAIADARRRLEQAA